jgi:hypothetical protein
MTLEYELENIRNKWKNLEIDELIQSECQNEAEPIAQLLMDLYNKILEENLDLGISANQLGEETGRSLGTLTRCAFLVGLEYPQLHELDEDFLESKPFVLLEEASSTIKKILILLIGILVENWKFSKEEGETNAQLGGRHIYRALIGCYTIGIKFYQNRQKLINKLIPADEIFGVSYFSKEGIYLQIKEQLGNIAQIKDQINREIEILKFIKLENNIEPILKTLLKDPDLQIRTSALDVLSKIEFSRLMGD